MAILNNILRGQLKGRIGNNYFATRKSATGRPQTVVGTINTSPSNPKSSAQMLQRARFANAVKFYRHAQANFYKFAFERQKPNETDYNVFMRMNIDRSPVLPKSWVDDPTFLAYSPKWLFSSGTLSIPSSNFLTGDIDGNSGAFLVFSSTHNIDTIGDLSRLMIDTMNLQPGDIVSIVVIGVDEPEFSEDDNAWVSGESPLWLTYQFVIDPSNQNSLEYIAFRGGTPLTSVESLGKKEVAFYNPIRPSGVFGFTVAAFVVTRKSGGKLLSTVSRVVIPDALSDIIDEQLMTYSEEEILATWQAQDDATLQGAIASSGEGTGVSSSGTPNVTSIVQESSAFNKDKMLVSSTYGVHVKGSNLGALTTSSFTYKNCTPIDYYQYSSQIYTLRFATTATAGTVQITYGDVTWQGTSVTSQS